MSYRRWMVLLFLVAAYGVVIKYGGEFMYLHTPPNVTLIESYVSVAILAPLTIPVGMIVAMILGACIGSGIEVIRFAGRKDIRMWWDDGPD